MTSTKKLFSIMFSNITNNDIKLGFVWGFAAKMEKSRLWPTPSPLDRRHHGMAKCRDERYETKKSN